MAKKTVVVTYKFRIEIPNPKPEFWIGDKAQSLISHINNLARELGWESEWRSTEFED